MFLAATYTVIQRGVFFHVLHPPLSPLSLCCPGLGWPHRPRWSCWSGQPAAGWRWDPLCRQPVCDWYVAPCGGTADGAGCAGWTRHSPHETQENRYAVQALSGGTSQSQHCTLSWCLWEPPTRQICQSCLVNLYSFDPRLCTVIVCCITSLRKKRVFLLTVLVMLWKRLPFYLVLWTLWPNLFSIKGIKLIFCCISTNRTVSQSSKKLGSGSDCWMIEITTSEAASQSSTMKRNQL